MPSDIPPKLDPQRPRLYGRAKGRPLRRIQQGLMDEFYPTIKIGDNPLEGLGDFDEVWYEIGFGAAEHLLWQAAHNPHVAVLGAEPFINGAAKAVAGAHDDDLKNVRVLNGDGRSVIDNLPDNSLDCLFVLFPDPWPKARHNKRRIITHEFLREAARVLKPGARFRFASDIIDYVEWTLTRIKLNGNFSFPAGKIEDWRQRGDDWPGTRYEAKAFREGRPCHYFEFIRNT